MVDRKHSIFIGPLFLGFHRHDVINMLVRKRQVAKYVLHEENYIFLWWKR